MYTPQSIPLPTSGGPLELHGLSTDNLTHLLQLFDSTVDMLFEASPDWGKAVYSVPAFCAAVIACGRGTPGDLETAGDLAISTQVDALTLVHRLTFTEADFATPAETRHTVDRAVASDETAPDEPRYLKVYRGCRRDVSLLLSAGHVDARRYPLATLWTEAALVRQRHARRVCLDAAVMQACVSSVISEKGGKHLRSLLASINECE